MKRFVPLAILLSGLIAVLASGTHRHLNWATLAENQAALHAWVVANGVLAPAVGALIYAAVTALSMPGLAILSVAYGLLFGTLLGAAVTVIGATAGAILIFLAARYALADFLARRFSGLTARLRPRLERDGFTYLLAIRFVPVFPFALVNLAAAMVGMRLAPYALATVLGIIPVTLMFASIGAGIGSVLAAGKEPDLSIIATPTVLLPLLGLTTLSLVPVIWRRWRGGIG